MTRKRTRPIIRGNIVVWPVIPRLTRGVNLARQRAIPDATANIVVLPVIHMARHGASRANWMDTVHLKPNDIGVVRATMRRQRVDKGFEQAMERLREIFKNPA